MTKTAKWSMIGVLAALVLALFAVAGCSSDNAGNNDNGGDNANPATENNDNGGGNNGDNADNNGAGATVPTLRSASHGPSTAITLRASSIAEPDSANSTAGCSGWAGLAIAKCGPPVAYASIT